MMEVNEWNSEFAAEQDTSNKCSSLISFEDGELVEYTNEGLNASEDSIENTTAETDDKIEFILKPSLKGITQAKKRLKAFTATKLLKNAQAKEDKNLNSNKNDTNTTKKLKKELYPDERARAVIQEIEEIKKAQARQQIQQIAFAESMKKIRTLPLLSAKSRSRSISSGDERLEGHFKRREIKVRNIRRGKTRSISPETHKKKKEKLNYPKNWAEYIQQNLDVKKDQELKSKLFPSYKRPNPFEVYKKLYCHQTPSLKIDPFIYSTNGGGSKEVPPFFIRFTKTYPSVQYSINYTTNDDSFITRKQLFSIISKDAKDIIEKLMNSNQRSPAAKVLKERHWFNKSWKKIGLGESKFVENSVGLSFLQTYSDDDNDANDEEEIIICSRVTTSEKPSEQNNFENIENIMQSTVSEETLDVKKEQEVLVHMDNNEMITEDIAERILKEIPPKAAEQMLYQTPQKIPEEISQEYIERTPEVLPEEVNLVSSQDDNEMGQTPDVRSSDGFRTPELRPNVESAREDRELDETRRAIEQLEDELKKKQEIIKDDVRHVIELDLKNVKKKKKKDIDVIEKSKKRKKKVKAKNNVSSDDDTSSTDEKKKSKKKSRVNKLKKKSEFEKLNKKAKKKKKRNTSVSDSSLDEEEEELPKKKTGKKKKHKETSKKLKNKELKKAKQKTDWDETDEETVVEYTDEEKTESRKLRKKLDEEHISKEKGDKQTSKHIFEIISSKDEPENREFGIELKINRKYLLRKGENKQLGEEDHLEAEELMSTKKPMKMHEEEFPLEKDIFSSHKDTVEKSPYPLWESEEEVSPAKSKLKLNTSWESDEEVFVRRHYEPELESEQSVSKSYSESCGKLEIPLNIKPYKKREAFEPEIDLKMQMEEKRKEDINFMGQIIGDKKNQTETKEDMLLCETIFDEETSRQRKPVENKQGKNFEGHINLEKESIGGISKLTENTKITEFKIDFGGQVAVTEKRQIEHENLEMSELEYKIPPDLGKNQVHAEREMMIIKDIENLESKIITPKRGRWDIRESFIKVSTPKSETDSVSTQSFHSEKNSSNNIIDLTTNNASSLENEYEEFLKAVTSNVAEDPEKSMPISISSISDISDTESLPVSFKKKDFIQKDKTSIQIPVVLPKDIPFIPMPAEVKKVKPVPVPSPKIDVKNKSLVAIDLDLIPAIQKPIVTANIEIPPVGSLDVAGISSSTMIQTPVSVMDDTSVSNSVDLNIDLKSINLPPPCESTSVVEDEEKPPVAVEETTTTKMNIEAVSAKPPEKQFSFSGMVLTTKKLLLDKPKLNFGDSDDDEPKTSLRKLDDIKKENAKMSIPKDAKVTGQKVTTEVKIGSDEKRIIEGNQEVEQPLRETVKEETKVDRKRSRSRSPHSLSATARSKEGDKKREVSPHKRRRTPSPRSRRRSSPSRRKESPRRGLSPRKRSPGRRRTPEKKKHPSRRSPSPRRSSGVSSRKKSRRSPTPRKRGMSPKKRSPSPKRRSVSPRKRGFSPKRKRSASPRWRGSPRKGGSPKSLSKRLRSKSPERIQTITESRPRTPPRATSPHEGLKRSIADSTISDDLLPQPNLPYEEYANSPTFFERRATDSPRRIPLEERISQVLGETKEEPKAITSTYGNYARYNQEEYSNQMDYPTTNYKPSSYVQVGNMLQIVPTELPTERPTANVEVVCQDKPSIIQVGNMLQIVPTVIPLQMPPLPQSPAPIPLEQFPAASDTMISTPPLTAKQSAEESMQQKVAERRAEREKRKLERDKKREEKEKKRKEKEKKRQIRLKVKTENMIKRALQLEVEGGEEEDSANESLVRWPPISVVCGTSKDIGKSILTKSVGKREGKSSSQKAVSFADGIRPGEGTSPSAGEELTSPPPKKLPKEKRYTKTNMADKIKKKKVKVKIIKKPLLPALSDGPDSDDEDLLPPPSPPPGSPPPHIFPPRVKVPAPNNLIPYAAATQLQIYGAQLGLMMAPPPPPPPPLPPTPPSRQSPVEHASRSLGTHSHSHRTQLYHF